MEHERIRQGSIPEPAMPSDPPSARKPRPPAAPPHSPPPTPPKKRKNLTQSLKPPTTYQLGCCMACLGLVLGGVGCSAVSFRLWFRCCLSGFCSGLVWVWGLGWVVSILRQPAGVLEAQGFSPTRGFSLGWFGAEHKSWFQFASVTEVVYPGPAISRTCSMPF